MDAGEDRVFSYHRSLAPMLWMFVLIAGVELLVVHLLVSLWSVTAALLLSAVSLATMVWVVLLIRAMRRRPVRIGSGRLEMSVGGVKRVTIPLTAIAGLREAWTAEDLRRSGVLNLALLAYPNVVVDLVGPLPGKRAVRAVAHRLDDAEGFAAALHASPRNTSGIMASSS